MSDLVHAETTVLTSPFDAIRRVDEHGVERWRARDLMEMMGYTTWEKFKRAIKRAMTTCVNSGTDVTCHFHQVVKEGLRADGQSSRAEDFVLTRYACYLVAMNGDPTKPAIAKAQAYFAVSTRIAEVQAAAAPEPARYLPWSQRLSDSFRSHQRYVHGRSPGWWSILIAARDLLLIMEDELYKHCLPLDLSDRPDGGMGLRWAHERRERGLPEFPNTAPLYLADLKRSVQVRLYPAEERGLFDVWLFQTYLPRYAPAYLKKKFGQEYGVLVTDSAVDNTCLEITGGQAVLPRKRRLALDQAGGFVPAGQLPAPQRPALPAPSPAEEVKIPLNR